MDMHALIKLQLQELLVVQDRMNGRVSENWAASEYPWYRSVLALCGTVIIIPEDDRARIKGYLVSIFSRLLSENMQACIKKGLPIARNPAALEFLAGSYSRGFQARGAVSFHSQLDEFIGACAGGHIPVHKFWGLCACVDLKWPELRLLFLSDFGENKALTHAA